MSQTDTKSITIDGVRFTVHMLDPWVANEILHMLGNLVGPSLGQLVGAVASKSGDQSISQQLAEGKSWAEKKIDPEFLSAGISGLFQRLDPTQTRLIMEQLAAVTTVGEKGRLSETFAAVFQGKIGAMYRWAAFAIKVNFADFFSSIPAAIEFVAQRAALDQ